MKEMTPISCWSFKTEYVHLWAYWMKVFTKEECDKIVTLAKSYNNLEKARVFQGKNKIGVEEKVRITNTIFLVPGSETQFIFEKITPIIIKIHPNTLLIFKY